MNSEIIEKYKLERSLPFKESEAFEKLLIKANESYVLLWHKEKDVIVGKEQYYKFEIVCPKTNFADAYFHIGLMWGKKILPIWDKRYKIKK